MFTKKTVIILGAGSSAEFGLPTGQGIFDHIAVPEKPILTTDLNEVSKKYNTFGSSFNNYYKSLTGDAFELDRLFNLGRQSRHRSIDQLAISNPTLMKQAKLLSSWCLLSKVYAKKTKINPSGNSYKSIEPNYDWRNTKVNGYPNWIATIVNEFLETGTSNESIDGNQLSIVSFNYDTIFEDSFWHFTKQDEIHRTLPKSIGPEIVQVFGSFPSIEKRMHIDQIENYSNMIQFMGEEDEELRNRVKKTKKLLNEAEKIFLIGFDCHTKNMDLIGLNHNLSADIYALNYSGDNQLNLKLETLGLPKEHIYSGNSGKPIGVSEALSKGFLSFAERFEKTRYTLEALG